MNRLPIPAVETAPAASQPLLAAVKQQLGMVPNLMKVLAHSPSGLGAYLGFSAATAGGALDTADRERIALVVAEANGCEYCLSAHTALGEMHGVDAAELAAARHGTSGDARAQAAITLALDIVDNRGRVSNGALANARAAGLSDGEVVETVAHVALNVFTNYFNSLAGTEVDFPAVRAPRRVPVAA